MEEKTVEYWLDIAQYDLDTAEAMCKTKRWLYVAFMCHQCIEKTLKAYWSGTRDDDPPYTHNHMRLAEGCGLYQHMSEEQKHYLDTIMKYNIESRYPDDRAEMARALTPEACRYFIDETKKLTKWIREEYSAATKHSASSDATSK